MTKKQKKTLYRIIAAAVLLVAAAVVCELAALPWWAQLVLHLAPYLVIGYDVLRKAVLGIVHGEVFDENFLMAIATVGAMAVGEYREGVAVMLFYQVGELFQSYAVGKSRRSIAALMDIRPTAPTWKTRTAACAPFRRRRCRWARPSWSAPASASRWTAWCWRAVPA